MGENSKVRRRVSFPRDVLLVEIVRHCTDAQCRGLTRIGLTKEEARRYNGFTCERCEQWNEEMLEERDVPEWWEELSVTGLDALRPQSTSEPDETSMVVTRLSDAWQRRSEGGVSGSDDDGGDGHDEHGRGEK